MRRPFARLSLTKSMLHTSLTLCAVCNGTRSDLAFCFLASPDCQVGDAVQAIYPLVVDAGKCRTQKLMDTSVAKSATRLRQVDDGGEHPLM
jgi:hypothetical protein